MALIRQIRSLLVSHKEALFVPLNFVRHLSADNKIGFKTKFKIETHYKFELTILLLAAVLGTIGLVHESDSNLEGQNLAKLISKSRYMFLHQMFVRQIWSVSDHVMAIMMAYLILVAYCSNLYGTIEERFCMVKSLTSNCLKIDGKKLSLEESAKLLALCHKANRVQALFTKAFLLVVLVQFYTCLWVNSAFNISILSLFYWLFILPFLSFYIVFEMFAKAISVIATAEYIRIRQQALLAAMTSLNRQFGAKCRKLHFKRYYLQIWLEYQRQSGQLVTICRHVKAYDNFWLPYLTLAFINYTAYESFVTYTILFTDSIVFALKLFLGLCVFNAGLLHYCLIRQCAQVVKYNRALLKERQKFCLQLQRCKTTNKLLIENTHLLKVNQKNT